VYTFQATEA